MSYILLGLAVGTASGLLGIGGAVLIIPALIYLFHLTQHQAQGTTLALMIPPIGLLAALTYYKQGFVKINIALGVCIGFIIGGLVGAKIACATSGAMLRKIYGLIMFFISLHMIFK